jgi:hypothetical protein
MKPTYLFLFLLLLSTASRGQSVVIPEWFETGVVSSSGDTSFFNLKYMSKVPGANGDSVLKVWIKTKYKKFVSIYGKTYTDGEQKTLYWFDCASGKMAVTKDLRYSKEGELVDSKDPPLRWDEPVPETVGYGMYALFCNKK